MKSKHLIPFLLLSLTTILAACDRNEAFYSEWIGDYYVKSLQTFYPDGMYVTTFYEGGKMIRVYSDGGTYEREIDREYPLSIFNEDGLYVQALGIGDPFMPNVDSKDHVLIARSPKRALQDDTIQQGIENVELSEKTSIVLQNGMIFTIAGGHMYSPKPIKVLRARSDSLVLQNGEPFDVPLTDASGQFIEQVHSYWKYSTIKKEQGICTWDAALYIYSDKTKRTDVYRHHLIFVKK